MRWRMILAAALALGAGPLALRATGQEQPREVAVTAPTASVQTANRFRVAWTATDDGSGVASYDVRYRRATPPGAAFTSWFPFRTATTRRDDTFAAYLNSRYCFSARARDRAGNTSPWSAERCTTIPWDADAPHPTCGRSGARVVRFRVFVERGLPTTRSEFASQLTRVLCDARSWIKSGSVRFRYDPKGALLIGLRTPSSTERRCRALIGLSVRSYYSCASLREVVLNSDRWFKGSDHLDYSVRQYRRTLVNHEVGHTQGMRHRGCRRAGAPAPVMMQQSKGLQGCAANVWPTRAELAAFP